VEEIILSLYGMRIEEFDLKTDVKYDFDYRKP
jgi:hypothetical protein